MYVEYITIGLHFEANKTDVTMYLSKKKKKKKNAGLLIENHWAREKEY